MQGKEYRAQLRELQIELVKLQRDVIAHDRRLLLLLEGRDAAGKDSTIKHVTRYMSPRETRVVALPKPTDRDQTLWYFQRYVAHLPAGGEIVLFNRSWYNRAGVERVMGFCTSEQYERFCEQVPEFERMLVRSGIELFKFYLDISREEQARRLRERRTDPLKAWKISPIDAVALEHWNDYSDARDSMFSRTHVPWAPWVVVRANNKKKARLHLIRHLLQHADYEGKDTQLAIPDLDVVFEYHASHQESGRISR